MKGPDRQCREAHVGNISPGGQCARVAANYAGQARFSDVVLLSDARPLIFVLFSNFVRWGG